MGSVAMKKRFFYIYHRKIIVRMLSFLTFFLILLLLIIIYFLIIKPLYMSASPLNRYHFSVEWGGTRIGFMEVSGLDIEIEAVTYREGSSAEDTFKKIPGLKKYSNITLKREIIKGDNDFFEWINTKLIGSIERRDVTIQLLDSNHLPVVVWKIRHAFPVHYYGPVLASNSNDLAMETLVLTHEGITVETA
jgi:phage tail-like protein